MNSKKFILFSLPFLAITSCAPINGDVGGIMTHRIIDENTIIIDKQSNYSILVSSLDKKAEVYAANELQGIIFDSTGCMLPIVTESDSFNKAISIGNTNLFNNSGIEKPTEELKNGGFILESKDKNYFINSNTEAGKIYGAYQLAEELCGYHFYAIDEIHVDFLEEIKYKDLHIKQIPSFDGRNIFSYETLHSYPSAVQYRANDIVSGWDESFGEATIWSTLDDTSNIHQLLSVKEYYNDHPNWFFLDDYAKKSAPNFKSMTESEVYDIANKHSQLCYSELLYDETDNGMFKTYTDNLKQYILNEPGKKLFMLGMADNEYTCNCDKCKEEINKYKYSGLMLRFTNKVAKEIKRWLKDPNGANMPNREIYLVQFAYLTTIDPPTVKKGESWEASDPSVVAEDNVCIRIAPLTGSNFYWDIDDPQKNKNMYNSIEGWKALTKHFTIWDYRLYFHYLVCPYPYFNTWKTNLEVYKKLDVIDIYHQGYSITNVPFQKLDDYVRSKLLYDLSLDPNELMDEFIDAYYKQAAPFIKEYIDFLKNYYELVLVPKGYSGSVYADIIKVSSWPIEVLMQIKNIFDKAYALLNDVTLSADEYKTLKERIDYESRFYRYALIDLYHNQFTKAELAQMISDWEDANMVNPLTEYAVREPMSDKLDEWKKYLD